MKAKTLKISVIMVTSLFILTMIAATVIAFQRPSSSTRLHAATIYEIRKQQQP